MVALDVHDDTDEELLALEPDMRSEKRNPPAKQNSALKPIVIAFALMLSKKP